MRTAVILAIVLAVIAVSATPDYDAMFNAFKRAYKKSYSSAELEGKARKAFEQNMKRAAELEKENPLAQFGMNTYADVDRADFKKTHHNADFSKHLKNRKPIEYEGESSSGKKIDWRTKGAVTHVKNQMQCGGCWSFSTTGNIEGQWFLAGHKLVSLSEQELLSCDLTGGNEGCGGGLMDYAFEWLVSDKNGIIETAASYPFVAGDGTSPACSQKNRVNGAQIYGHHDLPHDEDKMASYCYANGPISIGVDASSFQTYQGGILTNCQSGQLDHAVLIVGFDDTYSTPYWIIKNSWGVSWGEEGYIRVAKGSNQCGLDEASTTSLVKKNGPPVPSPSSSSSGPSAPSSSSSSSSWNPPPPPSGNNFTFSLCTDSSCQNCQQYSFPQGACIDEEFNGDSFTATCKDLGFKLDVNTYIGSQQCSGSPSSQSVWADTCYENVDKKTYLSFSCPF